MIEKKIRTRFAPSPTGYMHVGNLRTALYAYLIAKHENGTFILRIEDTDQQRYVEDAVEIIYNTLKMTGLQHDEGPDVGGEYGPYIQSDRKEIYQEHAKKLIDKGEAYHCFCDKERLDALKQKAEEEKIPYKYDKHCAKLSKEEVEAKLAANVPYVIRQNNPTTGTTSFDDIIFGTITVDNAEIEDMILVKSDGLPTYNFANVVDDHLMKITHVVRGSEYLSSTPKYNRLYQAFDWEIPVYVHCPPIMKDATNKLSKRNGDASFQDLIDKGYLKDAIINFIAFLGWSPGGEDSEKEIFSLEELIQKYNYQKINKSPAIFDSNKLNHINSKYIKALAKEEFAKLAAPFIIKSGLVTEQQALEKAEWLQKVIVTAQDNISYLAEAPEKVALFFKDDVEFENDEAKEVMSQEHVKGLLEVFIQKVQAAEVVNAAFAKACLKEIQKETGIKGKNLFMPIRVALTGQCHGPDLGEIIEIFNKDGIRTRVENMLQRI